MESDVINTPIEISKELEIINFRNLSLKYSHPKSKKNEIFGITKGKMKKWAWKRNSHVAAQKKDSKKPLEPQTQLAAFRGAMKLLLIIGQSFGLNPVRGFLRPDVADMRFTVFSWRFLYCILIGSTQAVATVLCLYRLRRESLSIGTLAFICFFGATCFTTFLFIQIAARWPKLMKEISQSRLDEYIDPRMRFKCNTATIVIVTLALVEHILSVVYKVAEIVNCSPDANIYDKFLRDQFPWFFELDIPRYIPLGIFLQIMNFTLTINWNYSDLFIVCMSMYLASILDQVNKKIISASEKKYLPSSYWRSLREDYTRATRLVRTFDEILSGVVFCSFATNLFFICLQLFNILSHGVKSTYKIMLTTCPKLMEGWIFGGYEYVIYLIFSASYLLLRSLTVSLVAASVHTASTVPAPALYNVPSSAFCDEVARFIEQVHADTVALSGLQFFFVTRDLVLSVAGTIVTYELVLLQFSSMSC